MKVSNKRMIAIAILIIAVCTLITLKSFTFGGVVSTLPLPLNAPQGASYKMPDNLPGKTGGPFLEIEKVKDIAADVAAGRGESAPIIKDIILTTHGALIQEGIFSPSFSVSNDREVYLVTMEGSFVFLRVPHGVKPIRSSYINIEIDATNDDALAIGTGPYVTPEILQRLKANQ